MGASESTGPATESHIVADGPVPAFVDWLVAVLIALGGLALLVGGTALTFVVDRELLATGIEGGTITVTLVTTELTDAEMLEFTLSIVSWTGLGLLVIGLGMILFAIGYVVRRHRARRRAGPDEPLSSYGANAVVGAVVTGLTSFLPFSPGIGGAVAGYLERADSERIVSVGALAGLLAMLPVLLILLFVLVGLADGFVAVGQSGLAIVTGAAMLFVLMIVATIGAGLGALGGYVGGHFAERRTA